MSEIKIAGCRCPICQPRKAPQPSWSWLELLALAALIALFAYLTYKLPPPPAKAATTQAP